MAMHDPEVSYSFLIVSSFGNLVLHKPLKIISFACTTTWRDFSTLQTITTLTLTLTLTLHLFKVKPKCFML